MNFFLFAGLLINSVFAQNCNRVPPATIVDLDNLPLTCTTCGVDNLINPIGAVPPATEWNPLTIPSSGYYRFSMTFAQPAEISSCDWWANTDGTHSPTGMKFYTAPGGSLLASTPSITTPMRNTFYDFPFIPSPFLYSVYVEVYKSTTWQGQMYYLSCNTCVFPSETSKTSSSATSVATVSSTATATATTPGTPTSVASSTVSVTPYSTRTGAVTRTFTPTSSITMSVSLSASAVASPSALASPSAELLVSKPAPLGATSANSSDTGVILGGVAVGLAALGLLFQAYKSASAPDANGKKPSLSEIKERMLGIFKTKALDITKDVEANVKEQVMNLAKDPSKVLDAIKDPNAVLNDVKESVTNTVKKAVTDNVPATDSSVILDIANEVLPNQITGDLNLKIGKEQLEVLQQVLQSMNKATDAETAKQA